MSNHSVDVGNVRFAISSRHFAGGAIWSAMCQKATFTTSLAMAIISILKSHQFGYSWFSTSLEECQMKRFVSHFLIGAALAAVVLTPIGDVHAETADEVRKRALLSVANQIVGPLKLWSIKNLRQSGVHETVDKRSKVKSISCTPGTKSYPVFHLEIYEEGQKPWTTKITFSDKVQFLPPMGIGDVAIPEGYSPTSVMVSIDSGSPHLKKANLSTGGRMYAEFPKYDSVDGTNAGQINQLSLKASVTGLMYTGEYGEVYVIPLRQNTIPDATALCKAKGADEIQTILKRIQQASSQ